MASIHRQPGKPNWFCAFYDPEGFRRFRSTGTSDARIAKTICSQIDRASNLARHGKLSNEKALKLIREGCDAIRERHGALPADRAHTVIKESVEEFVRTVGGEMTSYTIRSWINAWHAGRTDASKATLAEYGRILDTFLKFLGARADRALTTVQARQVEDFKAHLIARVSPSTVNKALKVLRACFNKAVEARQLEFNAASQIEDVLTEAIGRRAFTAEELTELMKSAKDDWRTMVMLGYYTGLRLRDCANLKWSQVDLVEASIDITPQKTQNTSKNRLLLPVTNALLARFAELPSHKPHDPVCPTLAERPSSWLSAQFYSVMESAGIVAGRDHQRKANGRDGKREASRISFHSLRYCTASGLRAQGISESVAMDIVGHETKAVHRHYAGKVPLETKREALSKLPDITPPA